MTPFPGFTSSETFTQVPDSFIKMMNEIEDVAELKVILYAIWRIEHMEGNFRAMGEVDFDEEALGLKVEEIRRGLGKAVERQTLLRAENEAGVFFFLNSPRGRLSAEAFAKGQVKPSASYVPSKSNVFKLYEENIGALTPLLADMLKEAEREYPGVWFEEAFEIAVSRNVRNWKYIEAILRRWKENGKDERRDSQDSIQDAKRYTDGEFSEFFKRD
ncbi:MAG: DnaD domain protein [Anaerolineales bacterium]|nr:DnaD domain protein [Anaerolineales bacterium]MCB9144683.1 DnaD domain protein [Anaerolineales bacterium]